MSKPGALPRQPPIRSNIPLTRRARLQGPTSPRAESATLIGRRISFAARSAWNRDQIKPQRASEKAAGPTFYAEPSPGGNQGAAARLTRIRQRPREARSTHHGDRIPRFQTGSLE